MSRTILIVDGSSVMRRVVERSLRLAGFDTGRVLEASDGAEALALVGQSRCDLILTELNLANLDGLALLRQLRDTEATRTVPVVIVASQAGESQVMEALALGASGYIRKPFTPDQIKDYVGPIFAGAMLPVSPLPARAADS